ncbi:fructose-1-phosphate kinase [Psychrobacillus sp. OK028]|uniref:1-phosphofructokinase n=1 Tax=Psychrobacillus sp. OK028 TaxID=1884359 RepID=UPI000891312B|nr:1-phosphofructokinase [Psychrobacillus sp. OK028]SDM41167.1 fructose-1-phosphate kinase [Psychrobacillus sp. OK028]
MIYTCTITPSIDYTVYLPTFENGKLNRSEEVYYYPGGKGINVSRVLKRLGVESKALGFTGGFTGSYIEDFLQKEGVDTDFIETSEITRINIKIKSDKETELNGPGPQMTEQQLMVLTNKVKAMKKGDWFILAGSLPNSITDSYFLDLAEICRKNGVRFVLDTSGPALKNLTKVSSFLIKPNLEELGELFSTEINDINEAHYYAKQLLENGIEHVIVSLGGDGALLVTKELSLRAKAPNGVVVNTVGSGDSLVSGFIASYSKDENPEEAFRYGVASGSATAFRSDLCDQQGVEVLLEQVEITPI